MKHSVHVLLMLIMLTVIPIPSQASHITYFFAYQRGDVLNYRINIYGDNDTLVSQLFDDEKEIFYNQTNLEVIFLADNNTDDVAPVAVNYENRTIENKFWQNPFAGLFMFPVFPYQQMGDNGLFVSSYDVMVEGNGTGYLVFDIDVNTYQITFYNGLLPLRYDFVVDRLNGTVLENNQYAFLSSNDSESNNTIIEIVMFQSVVYEGYYHSDSIAIYTETETSYVTRTDTVTNYSTVTTPTTITDVRFATSQDTPFPMMWFMVLILIPIIMRSKK